MPLSRRRFPRVLGCAALLSALAAPARAQEAPLLRVDALELTLNGRVHTQLNTTDDPALPSAQWRLRRVRLEARVRVNELVSGKIQPDFAGDRLSVKDAYLLLTPGERVQLLVGQAHRPFSTLLRYSSLRMAPVEKGLSIRGVEGWEQQALLNDLDYGNRDVGVQLLGTVPVLGLPVGYAAALLQGPVTGVVGRSPFQLVARLEASPLADVELAAAWSRRHFLDPVTPSAPARLSPGQAVMVSAAYDPAVGLFAIAEASAGDFDPVREETFRGAHLWAGYRLPLGGAQFTRLEPILRISHGSVTDAEAVDGSLLTPGLNLYFGALNRAMFNYDLWFPAGGGERRGSFKAMFQLAF